MKIAFFLSRVEQTPKGLSSPIASARMRGLIPAAYLQALGHECQIICSDRETDADLFFIGKTEDPLALEVVKKAKEQGKRVIVDACDDTRGSNKHLLLGQMCQLADVITVSTPELGFLFRELYDLETIVVPDCVEGRRMPPKSVIPDVPTLLWFGHASNLDGLREVFEPIQHQCELIVCTNDIDLACEKAGVKAKYAEWDLESQFELLDLCDATLITPVSGDRGKVKSPNRIMTSLWAGRPVILCSSTPSYDEFRDFTYPDLSSFQEADDHTQKVESGQTYTRIYSGVALKQWGDVCLNTGL